MARSPCPVPFYPLGMRGGGSSGLHAYWYAYFFSLCAKGGTKPMDQIGLPVPTAIPSDFPMCFACPPRLAVAFTASVHTGMSSGRRLGVATS